ncbi:hypothetical protein ABW19_dt0206436 [Dactylella cylindrospora]|nr:hypothetical protein ABW19_dt0206436 [Dactylella cylindrospora]
MEKKAGSETSAAPKGQGTSGASEAETSSSTASPGGRTESMTMPAIGGDDLSKTFSPTSSPEKSKEGTQAASEGSRPHNTPQKHVDGVCTIEDMRRILLKALVTPEAKAHMAKKFGKNIDK